MLFEYEVLMCYIHTLLPFLMVSVSAHRVRPLRRRRNVDRCASCLCVGIHIPHAYLFMQFRSDAGDGNLAAVNSFIAKYPKSINCQDSVSCGITLCNVYMYVYVGQYVCICPCLCVS